MIWVRFDLVQQTFAENTRSTLARQQQRKGYLYNSIENLRDSARFNQDFLPFGWKKSNSNNKYEFRDKYLFTYSIKRHNNCCQPAVTWINESKINYYLKKKILCIRARKKILWFEASRWHFEVKGVPKIKMIRIFFRSILSWKAKLIQLNCIYFCYIWFIGEMLKLITSKLFEYQRRWREKMKETFSINHRYV